MHKSLEKEKNTDLQCNKCIGDIQFRRLQIQRKKVCFTSNYKVLYKGPFGTYMTQLPNFTNALSDLGYTINRLPLLLQLSTNYYCNYRVTL